MHKIFDCLKGTFLYKVQRVLHEQGDQMSLWKIAPNVAHPTFGQN
jgi:hypothetical protein